MTQQQIEKSIKVLNCRVYELSQGDDTGGGVTPGLQAVINSDSTLTKDNTVTLGANNLAFAGGAGGTVTLNSGSAALQVDSTAKGFLPPRLTGAQRDSIASPTEGLIEYNKSTHMLEVYTGTGWAGTVLPPLIEQIVTDTDIITACLAAGSNFTLANKYQSAITPANSKVALKGQFIKSDTYLFFALSDNLVTRIILG